MRFRKVLLLLVLTAITTTAMAQADVEEKNRRATSPSVLHQASVECKLSRRF